MKSWELRPKERVYLVRGPDRAQVEEPARPWWHGGSIRQPPQPSTPEELNRARCPAVFLFRDTIHACFEVVHDGQCRLLQMLLHEDGDLRDDRGRTWSIVAGTRAEPRTARAESKTTQTKTGAHHG